MYIRLLPVQIMLVALLLTGLPVQAQQPKGFVLKGRIKGLPDKAPLFLLRNMGKDTVAVTTSRNGKFVFSAAMPREGECYFIKTATKIEYRESMPVFMINAPVTVEANMETWPAITVSGSPVHQDYLTLLRQPAENNARFVAEHPASLYSATLVLQTFPYREMKKAYEQFSPEVKESYYGHALQQRLAAGSLDSGETVNNFSGLTPAGTTIFLQEVLQKNKYTLLDFWASWCTPCRKGNPDLKRMYDTYRDKGFAILSITCDENTNEWKKAIEADGMNWHHIIDEQAKGELLTRFGISGVPLYVLLNNRGKVIIANADRQQLETQLQRLLAN